jgi:hypothetical protein
MGSIINYQREYAHSGHVSKFLDQIFDIFLRSARDLRRVRNKKGCHEEIPD